MSANFGSGGSNSQDFDLNIASIIDCFTVLIAFMLVSASFLSIGILDAGIAASADAAASSAPPPVNFTVELSKNYNMTVRIQGQTNRTIPITATAAAPGIMGTPGTGPSWNFPELTSQLEALKKQWPTIGAITLTADNSVEYKDVVKAMDVTRKSMPNVLLGGF